MEGEGEGLIVDHGPPLPVSHADGPDLLSLGDLGAVQGRGLAFFPGQDQAGLFQPPGLTQPFQRLGAVANPDHAGQR